MKKDGLLICLALLLASCQSMPALRPSSTPIPPTPTNTPTPTFTPIPPTPTSTPSPSPEPTLSPTNGKNDYLVYQVNSLGQSTPSKPQFALYDPSNNATLVLSPDLVGNDFSLSKNNRLAFKKDGNIYVWDYPFTGNTQSEINFDGSPTTQKEVLSWSLDGRYLLLTGVQENRNKLFLWDGKHILDLYSYQGVISSGGTTWSNNDKLAFTERFIYNNSVTDWGDIYVWDGKSIVKVNQNPSGSPAWSKDGRQLAFSSYQAGEYIISIWDGKSKSTGAPDVKTLAAPDLELSISSHPTWTNSGSIVFTGLGQIYEWHGQTTRNISQTPSIDFYGLAWRNDGYWSAVTYQDSSPHYALFIRDNANRTVLETEGTESAWTQSGLLVFCNYRNSHTLSIWNGKNIVDLAHGDSVFAEWTSSNGKSIWCTYG